MLEQARLKAEQQEIKNIQFWSKIYWQIPWSKNLNSLLFVGFFTICPDLDAALSLFHQHLKEDGQLLLADFTKTEANHHGFELVELENKLAQFGFHLCIVRSSIALKTCFKEITQNSF